MPEQLSHFFKEEIENEIKRVEQEAQELTRQAKQLNDQYQAIGMQMRKTRELLLIVEGQFRAFKSMLPPEPKDQKKKMIGGERGKKNE